MLLIDDILLFPGSALAWISREVHHAALEERAGEGEAINAELRELYMMLETGKITEAEFVAREKVLLDRLDAMQPPEEEEQGEDEGEGAEEVEEDQEDAEE